MRASLTAERCRVGRRGADQARLVTLCYSAACSARTVLRAVHRRFPGANATAPPARTVGVPIGTSRAVDPTGLARRSAVGDWVVAAWVWSAVPSVTVDSSVTAGAPGAIPVDGPFRGVAVSAADGTINCEPGVLVSDRSRHAEWFCPTWIDRAPSGRGRGERASVGPGWSLSGWQQCCAAPAQHRLDVFALSVGER